MGNERLLLGNERLLLGNERLLLGNERLLLGIIGVFGLFGICFLLLGVLGTPWVWGPRRGFQKYLTYYPPKKYVKNAEKLQNCSCIK